MVKTITLGVAESVAVSQVSEHIGIDKATIFGMLYFMITRGIDYYMSKRKQNLTLTEAREILNKNEEMQKIYKEVKEKEVLNGLR